MTHDGNKLLQTWPMMVINLDILGYYDAFIIWLMRIELKYITTIKTQPSVCNNYASKFVLEWNYIRSDFSKSANNTSNINILLRTGVTSVIFVIKFIMIWILTVKCQYSLFIWAWTLKTTITLWQNLAFFFFTIAIAKMKIN